LSLTLLLLLALEASAPAGMALIPAGDFWMGRNHLWLIEEIGWQALDRMDDRPLHLVYLDAFYIDHREVSNAQYAEFVEAADHRPPYHWAKGDVPREAPGLPVYNVSWDDANAYCTWASKRLPSEAEWEKAARGGIEGAAHPWGDDLEPSDEAEVEVEAESDEEPPKLAHYGYPEGPTETGRFAPNGYGLHDVIGNVWEWVADGYELHYYSVSPRDNPGGPAGAPYRVYRGGSWSDYDDRLLSVFYRNFTDPATRASTIGFRCASTANSE